MALTQVTGPYPIFTDLDGSPLDDGYLYIGAINEDPETNPIQVFWDSDLTIPATQPIRTNSGYAWRNGTPALLYTAGEFSITIRNKRQEFVLYSPVGYGFDPAAVSASVVKNDFIGDGVEVDFTLSSAPSTILATNVFINGVYQEKDSYSLSGNVITFSIAPPLSSSIEVMTNETGVINAGNATAISYTASFPGAVQQTVQTKLEQYVSVKDFGAVGDGVTDDTAAIQAALDSGAKTIVGVAGDNYMITAPLTLSASGVTFSGYGATITQATTNTNGLEIGYDGASFVQVSDITISGFEFVGADDGLTTTASGAIVVYSTSANPYTTANGCQRIKVDNCRASGWAFGVVATGVNGLLVSDSYFTGMKYHSSTVAGGYGVLAQTCFDVQVVDNRFVAQNGDRHAIYISADPSRTKNSDNVCKQVVVSGNIVDWTGVSAITGFETCMMSRGVFDFTVSNNVFKGGYGGLDYEIENAPGENISITGNVFDGVLTPGTSTRGAVNFLRTAGSNRASNITVSGNSIKLSGEYAIGVQIDHSDYVSVTGNTINSPNNTSSFGINCLDSTAVTLGSNVIRMGNGYAAIAFNGANDNITIDKNQISGASYFRFKFFSNPTNLRFGYNRTFAISTDGLGGITVVNGDEDVVSAAASDVNGVSIDLQPWVDVNNLNITFSGANSSVGWVYYRSSTGSTVVCGVTNHAGLPLAAATNAYYIVGNVLS